MGDPIEINLVPLGFSFKELSNQIEAFEEAKKVNYDDLIQRLPEWGDPEKGSQVKQAVKTDAFTSSASTAS